MEHGDLRSSLTLTLTLSLSLSLSLTLTLTRVERRRKGARGRSLLAACPSSTRSIRRCMRVHMRVTCACACTRQCACPCVHVMSGLSAVTWPTCKCIHITGGAPHAEPMGRPAPHAEPLAVAAAAAAAAAFRTLGGGGGGGGGARGEGIAGDCTDVSAGPRQPREGAAGLGVRYDGGRHRGGPDLVGLSSVAHESRHV